ncbi:MAG TPA: 50S ribosomal protein L29 [Spirochaetota bacterium]|jgi:ribosomal protein L29|nr:50S ribosomal protein L29 [Spirochaetota bacterium]HOA07231.1 50S ribosomal protein L29 [Spirochaetota bacterium]HOF33235.1 50S ribosomal protein L29 [Spirochaetota bacterium]HOH36206.1 50S ribosomal protein L29 [Spirochaetota bacterium]HOR44031.1 50S ribosomal protein L29 [Spirochaetota bacterium]
MKEKIEGLTEQELTSQYNAAKESIRKLRFQSVTGKLENTKSINNLKKKIARILTLRKEYELGIKKR